MKLINSFAYRSQKFTAVYKIYHLEFQKSIATDTRFWSLANVTFSTTHRENERDVGKIQRKKVRGLQGEIVINLTCTFNYKIYRVREEESARNPTKIATLSRFLFPWWSWYEQRGSLTLWWISDMLFAVRNDTPQSSVRMRQQQGATERCRASSEFGHAEGDRFVQQHCNRFCLATERSDRGHGVRSSPRVIDRSRANHSLSLSLSLSRWRASHWISRLVSQHEPPVDSSETSTKRIG